MMLSNQKSIKSAVYISDSRKKEPYKDIYLKR